MYAMPSNKRKPSQFPKKVDLMTNEQNLKNKKLVLSAGIIIRDNKKNPLKG